MNALVIVDLQYDFMPGRALASETTLDVMRHSRAGGNLYFLGISHPLVALPDCHYVQ